MRIDFRYLGTSAVSPQGQGMAIRFSPNLAREKVFYDADLRDPLRFREAISALHDVVVGDLRFVRKDKTAYREWKKEQAQKEKELREQVFLRAHKEKLKKIIREAENLPSDLDQRFRQMHRVYWGARHKLADVLIREDPELFRHLVPCDPVVTVAPDIVFFECFSKDESSYGCLSVDRGSFTNEGSAGLGTTNVDYSLALYDHFQTLRSYRPTRLLVDPEGFEVNVEGVAGYREEKIDLPPSWLRGFGQLQAAMSLPAKKVVLPVEVVYSILAYLKRHREKTGPRSIRFQLTPRKPPVILLDPWGVEIPSHGPLYEGERPEEIKVWGRRRLMTLARILPFTERFEVRLLGSGLPSVWVAFMGEMRFQLALSGWTANDWTSGSNLDLLFGSYQPDEALAEQVLPLLRDAQRATLPELVRAVSAQGSEKVSEKKLLGSLNLLAKQGQVVYDFAHSCYRYRQVMPVALSEKLLGPEHPELIQGRLLASAVKIGKKKKEGASVFYQAKVQNTSCEAAFDPDMAFVKAKCTCSYFYKNRLRAGPCRHLLALRLYIARKEGGTK